MPFFSPDCLLMVGAPWVILLGMVVSLWWMDCEDYWQKDRFYPWTAEKVSGLSDESLMNCFLYYSWYRVSWGPNMCGAVVRKLKFRRGWKRRLLPSLLYSNCTKIVIINDERLYVDKKSKGDVFPWLKHSYYYSGIIDFEGEVGDRQMVIRSEVTPEMLYKLGVVEQRGLPVSYPPEWIKWRQLIEEHSK